MTPPRQRQRRRQLAQRRCRHPTNCRRRRMWHRRARTSTAGSHLDMAFASCGHRPDRDWTRPPVSTTPTESRLNNIATTWTLPCSRTHEPNWYAATTTYGSGQDSIASIVPSSTARARRQTQSDETREHTINKFL
jgi:hypothetical protein